MSHWITKEKPEVNSRVLVKMRLDDEDCQIFIGYFTEKGELEIDTSEPWIAAYEGWLPLPNKENS